MKCETCGGTGTNTKKMGLPECSDCHGTGEICCIRINRGPLTREDCERHEHEYITGFNDGVWKIAVGHAWRCYVDKYPVTAWAVLPKVVE